MSHPPDIIERELSKALEIINKVCKSFNVTPEDEGESVPLKESKEYGVIKKDA